MGPGIQPPPPDGRGQPIRCPLCYLIVNGPTQYNRHCCLRRRNGRWELKRKLNHHELDRKRWKPSGAHALHEQYDQQKPALSALGQLSTKHEGLEEGPVPQYQLHHRKCWSCGWGTAPYECKECRQAFCGWHSTNCFWCDEYVCEEHAPPRAHHCRCLSSRMASR